MSAEAEEPASGTELNWVPVMLAVILGFTVGLLIAFTWLYIMRPAPAPAPYTPPAPAAVMSCGKLVQCA